MIGKQQILTLIVGVALAALAFLISHIGLLDDLELKTLDLRFRVRGPIARQTQIVLISIDQDSFDELRLPWPWPRNIHADLIRKLTQAGSKIIAFDILFTEPKPDPKEDQELAMAIKDAGNVILGADHAEVPSDFGPKTIFNLPIPEIRDNALGYGMVNLIRSGDGIVRSAEPMVPFQDREIPSFAVRIVQVLRRDMTSRQFSHNPLLINFRGPARTFPIVPYHRVLKEEIEPTFFRDKIVLIGAFADSLHDVFPTPYSASQPMAGVEIQANLVETLMDGRFIVAVHGVRHWAVFLILTLGVISLSLQLTPLKTFAVVSMLTAMFAFACVWAFVQYRMWFPMMPSLVGIVFTYGGLTLLSYVREQRERLRYRAEFKKYVSPEVVEEILKNRDGLALGGKRRHITVLFSDVRGFTGISEKIAPEQVVAFLDEYFAQVTQIIFNHHGTVDKFMGDGLMAFFGAPIAHDDDAARAVRAGLEIIRMVEEKSAEWAKFLGRPLAIGVGINSGDAVVGRIGSTLHSNYTAIGDTVNLASRLEALTKELALPLLVSEATVAELSEKTMLTPLQHVKVVGRDTPVLVYTAVAYVPTEIATGRVTMEPYVQQHK